MTPENLIPFSGLYNLIYSVKYIRVRAENCKGKGSYSYANSTSCVPAIPKNFYIKPGEAHQLKVYFDPVPNADKYILEYISNGSLVPLKTVPAGNNFFVVDNVPPDNTHTFSMRTQNSCGKSAYSVPYETSSSGRGDGYREYVSAIYFTNPNKIEEWYLGDMEFTFKVVTALDEKKHMDGLQRDIWGVKRKNDKKWISVDKTAISTWYPDLYTIYTMAWTEVDNRQGGSASTFELDTKFQVDPLKAAGKEKYGTLEVGAKFNYKVAIDDERMGYTFIQFRDLVGTEYAISKNGSDFKWKVNNVKP